jgi:pimeloyl-ACP methyl ester carboxylesterase
LLLGECRISACSLPQKDKRQIEAFSAFKFCSQAAGRVGTVSKAVAARKARSDPGALTKFYPIALTRDGVRKHFVQDIPADEADIVFATQGPLAVKCFGDKISEAAWRSKPSWYIVAPHDETIPPDVERDSAKRMGAETLVLESSHVPMLSQPVAVAEFIAKAAASL